MSFSTTVKEELVRIKSRREPVKRAQLAAITHVAGVLRLGRAFGVEYVTETQDLGKHIVSLASGLYDVRAELSLRDTQQRRQSLMVAAFYGTGCEKLLYDAGLFLRTTAGVELIQRVPQELLADEECKRAFLRGAFLGAGSCSTPKRAYHLEIVCRGEPFAQFLCQMMEEYDCGAKIVLRKEKPVVYLKEGDRIAAFLTLIGASGATLAFEDVRAEKELRNYINRTSNCETANIGKTVNAAAEQVDAIRLLQERMGLNRLPLVLRETAELRLNYPEASLPELCELAGVSKSCIYHRLQRIVRLAREME